MPLLKHSEEYRKETLDAIQKKHQEGLLAIEQAIQSAVGEGKFNAIINFPLAENLRIYLTYLGFKVFSEGYGDRKFEISWQR